MQTPNLGEVYKNFREFVAYVKGREEKVSLVESKLKASESEKTKIQSNIDEVWKDYEQLEASFAKLKECSDLQKAELKKHTDREQDLESKNLELIMKFTKEQATQKITLAAEGHRFESAKVSQEACEEANRMLQYATQEANEIIEDQAALLNSYKVDVEQANVEVIAVKLELKLLEAKHLDTIRQFNEIQSENERNKAKLLDAYDVLEAHE